MSYHSVIQCLSSSKIFLWLILTHDQDWNFSERNHPQKKNTLKHYYQMLNLAFAADFIFLENSNLKLQGKIAFRCETYNAVKSFQQLTMILITSDALLHTFPVLANVKTRSKTSIPTEICNKYSPSSSSVFLDFTASPKKISIFQNPLNLFS